MYKKRVEATPGYMNQEELDLVIDGSILAFWWEAVQRLKKVPLRATAEATISVHDPENPDRSISKRYSGYYEDEPTLGLSWGEVENMLNDALQNMVRDFTVGSDLLELVKGVDRPSDSF